MHVHVLCMWQCLYIYIAIHVYCNVLISCILYKMHIMSSGVARGGGGDGGRPPRAAHLGKNRFGVDEIVRMKDESFQRYKFGKNR